MPGPCSRFLVRPFTDRMLAVDLAGLSAARRAEVSGFTAARVDELPSVLRIGVHCIAAPLRLIIALPGADRVIAWSIRHPVPLVGEYVRMLRSLAFTYIWEKWPETLPGGATATATPAATAAGPPAKGARP